MNKITILCANLSREELHQVIAEKMNFPSWYGQNLDALYDCLTDLEEDTHLVLQELEDAAFRATVLDAALNCSALTVTLE